VPELCVYALASPRAGRITVRGVAGEPLHAIRVGRIDAIVGRVRAVPPPTGRNLRRFDRMMSALWRRTPALLPARFGTASRDAAELDAMIRGREGSLRRRLAAVRNRAQMTVRLLDHDEAARPPREQAQTGTQYLRARQHEQAVPAFDPLRASVRRWVREERMEKRAGVASIYHLIPRGAVDRYRIAITRRAREQGVRIIVSGPWPPYAFADTW
jgi:hypothetical protein